MFDSSFLFSRKIFLAFFIAVVVAVLFWGARDNSFVWDDQYFIVQLPDLRNANSVVDDVLLKRFFISDDYYRPLPLLTYYLQAKSGLDPEPFHDLNLAIHIANALLVFLICHLLISRSHNVVFCPPYVRNVASAVLALLYAVHPAMAEAVVWVSGRFDLLMTLFLLLALYSDQAIKVAKFRAFCVGCFFLLAAFSKEAAVGFCFSLPMLHLVNARLSDRSNSGVFFVIRENIFTYTSLVIAGCIYLWVRYEALGYLLSGMHYNDYGSWIQRILLSAKALLGYLKIALLPFLHLSPVHYEKFPIELDDWVAWGALVAVLLYICTTLYGVVKDKWWSLTSASIFLLALIPALHLFQSPLADNLVQERYLQFPLAVLVVVFSPVLVSFLLNVGEKIRTLILGATACFVFISVVTVQSIIPLWSSELGLWTWVTATSPKYINGWINLANARFSSGDVEGAKEAIDTADVLAAEYGRSSEKSMILVHRGMQDIEENNPDAAIEKFLKVLDSEGTAAGSNIAPIAFNNAFNTLLRMNELESAAWYVDNAVNIEELSSHPWFIINVGIYWYLVGDKEKAEENLSTGINLMAPSDKRDKVRLYFDRLLKGEIEYEFFPQ
ncbi:tetratricopeptide repeat protein [Microbulbifer aggregans]|uniref:tetratricopeptide repeat protein n=1 Tax=Microbulbifer aggregans TaxID=1769779 RepID=UPI001CFD4BD1|nr:hypothetical protein [Microbulbifer aggregans]